jgi:hypothetical protein
MTERVPTLCDFCGQTDDHPKAHIGDVTKHHDCLSYAEEQQLRGSSDAAAAIIDACKGGKRGAKLLAHIESLHKEG